jgi:tetratricopeptide (TPR) repeat protein
MRVMAMILVLLAGGGAVVSSLPASAPLLAEEDPVARALFDSGKQSLSKRRYAEAVRFFRKALDESSDLIVAAYWEAQAHEKLKSTSAALAAYRRYVSLYLEKKALDEVSKSETALHGKAGGRIEKLAAGERALADLQSAFVTKLIAFADNHEADDPGVARDALKAVLSIDPGHPDARSRWEDLGGGDDEGDGGVAPATKAPPGPFERLRKGPWHDLIANKSLGTNLPKYEGGSMIVDAKGGKILRPTERIKTGERFVVDMDFRVLQEHESSWLVGIVVGWEGEEFYSAFTQRGQVVLNRGHAKQGPLEDIEQHPMKPIDPKRWHRLSVRVEGRAMVVWFDGDVVCRTEVDDPKALQGEICLFHQRCKAEYRLLQSAELE